MSDTAITAKNVSLTLDIGSKRRENLFKYFIGLFKKKGEFKEINLLDNISFTVKKGGALAVIGAEGAGKTTLLKLIAGIIPPSKGKILTEGSIYSVFAEDKGFENNLSAEENVYISGSMRGFTREYIKKRFKKIIEFAELEGYEKTALKRFSHDMSLRLAFSIAVHLKTDILLLDEALSACSDEFRDKCEDRLMKMRENGTAVVMISHDANHMIRLCEEAIWIDNGGIALHDTAQNVCEAYNVFCELL